MNRTGPRRARVLLRPSSFISTMSNIECASPNRSFFCISDIELGLFLHGWDGDLDRSQALDTDGRWLSFFLSNWRAEHEIDLMWVVLVRKSSTHKKILNWSDYHQLLLPLSSLHDNSSRCSKKIGDPMHGSIYEYEYEWTLLAANMPCSMPGQSQKEPRDSRR
jgi:hypothetical protein